MNKKFFLICILFLMASKPVSAQFYSVKSNVLGLATTHINGEFSFTINRSWSVHIPVQYCPFVFGNNRQFRNLTSEPGVRYWFQESYSGIFLGTNTIISRYHIGNFFNKYRYDGSAYGAGVTFGKAWPINPRWNFELEAGVGLIWTDYTKYNCKKCGLNLGDYTQWLVVPTKVSVALVYLF